MAEMPTGLANSIEASDDRAKLDAVAKKLIKHRIILAEILKECTDEFKDFDVSYIEQNCFASEVQVNVNVINLKQLLNGRGNVWNA